MRALGALGAVGKCILAGRIATALLALSGTAHAGGYSVLYAFCSQPHCTDGSEPSGVIRDNAGNLYGTTEFGGNLSDRGVVFKLAADGTETVLHTFCRQVRCRDGAYPIGGVIKDSAGNLFGTAFGGGSRDGGLVFKLPPGSHTKTVLYNFCSQNNCTDGYGPEGGVIKDSAGNLYGTTFAGGTYGDGVVFKLAPGGTETVLYDFCSQSNCADGADPSWGLIEDQSGNFYGTALNGGTHDGGVVFKVAPDGSETVLYSFCSQANCSDGGYPRAGVIEDQSRNLYGTAEFGGNGGCDGGETCGVVFKIAANGTYTLLHKFSGVDGGNPIGGLIRDTAGNLYGTTFCGGLYCSSYGTVFKLAPDGTETLLHSFAGGSDYKWPMTGLIEDKAGNLYGTTVNTVFKLRK